MTNDKLNMKLFELIDDETIGSELKLKKMKYLINIGADINCFSQNGEFLLSKSKAKSIINHHCTLLS